MQLGVKRGTVCLQEYNPLWPQLYQLEKEKLIGIFGNIALQIEHVGSTSVPHLKSKPLLDIAIQVDSLDMLGNVILLLEEDGYEERVGRLKGKQRVFAKGGDENVTHHLHIIEKGEKDWDEKIKFRNILLSNPDVLESYAKLKESLYQQYSNNRFMYTQSKADFIKKILNEY